MKTLLILLSLLTINLVADCEFERTVESISYTTHAEHTIAVIRLSDGSSWKWSPDLYSENLLRKWREGDQIIIRTANHPGFILQNLQRPHYMPTVSLCFDSYESFPYIESIGDMGKAIQLSDGTEWELVYDFDLRSLSQWGEGDRVIPMKGFQETFELINLDIPFENHRLIERNIQVAQSKCPIPLQEHPLKGLTNALTYDPPHQKSPSEEVDVPIHKEPVEVQPQIP